MTSVGVQGLHPLTAQELTATSERGNSVIEQIPDEEPAFLEEIF